MRRKKSMHKYLFFIFYLAATSTFAGINLTQKQIKNIYVE